VLVLSAAMGGGTGGVDRQGREPKRRWGPMRSVGRSVRRFRRRSVAMQLRTVVVLVVVAAGVTVYVAGAPVAPAPGAVAPSIGSGPGGGLGGGSGEAAAILSRASTSTRGIVGNTINVVFPVVSLSSLAGRIGFAEDVEFGEQAKAIHLFVNHVNHHGGINGRKINAILVTFTPANTSEMRSLCKDWTQGTPAAFVVLDGFGTWTGTNQLCITQEGHTPLLSQWTTVTTWTTMGAPYLWWTGPDQAPVLQATVDWGLATGLIGGDQKVGVVAGNGASDQLALSGYLLPDLRRAGVTPIVKTIVENPTDTATTDAEAPLVVQELKAAGVSTVIPLMLFNAFYPVLQAETQQGYFPKLLLSDYQSSIESALGLIPAPYEKALNGQEGVTTETLGGIDDNRPESQGGYDPGVRRCFNIWHKAYPQVPKGNMNFYIEEQGPVQAWCTAIHLFATAARNAGPDLNRRTFVEAMSKITDFPGGFSPTLSFGPDKYYGPTEYRVVKLHTNTPPSSACRLPRGEGGKPSATCWVVVKTWRPLPSVR